MRIICYIREISWYVFFHSADCGLDDVPVLAGPNEGVSCDNEPFHLEFTALISTCSSGRIHLEKYDSQYVGYIIHTHTNAAQDHNICPKIYLSTFMIYSTQFL